MDYLAEFDENAALRVWKRLFKSDSGRSNRFVMATAGLIGFRLFEFWDEVWPFLLKRRALAKKVFLTFDSTGRRGLLPKGGSAEEARVSQLYLYLRELFPPVDDDPIPKNRAYTPTNKMELARMRDGLPNALAAMGTPEAVEGLWNIAQSISPQESIWMRWKWKEAIVAMRRKDWEPCAPELILALVAKANRRWIVDEDDLVALIVESLDRLEENLQRKANSQVRDYWVSRKGPKTRKYFRPDGEVEISRRITTWLQMDLASAKGITVQREVQIQWDGRTDIEVRAVALDGNELRPIEIVIEVKGCWHAEVLTAHKTQLVDRYLKKSGSSHGVYLIVWTDCDRWDDPEDNRKSRLKSKSIEAAKNEIQDLVDTFDGVQSREVVEGVVLDASL